MNYLNNFKFVLSFILLISFDSVNAQFPNLLFNHLTVDDGLSENTIHTIIQDKDGFMWFGTYRGLNKYDGYEFTVYSTGKGQPGALLTNNIIEVFEDSYGLFWVGTEAQGLYLFDREKEWFHLLENIEGDNTSLSNNRIRVFFEDSENNLWVGTAGGGLCLFNRSDSTFKSFRKDSTNPTSIGSDYISSISEDANGFLWLGSPTGELIKFNKTDTTFVNYKLYEGERYYLSSVYGSTLIDSDNDVWFCTANGVFILDPEKESIIHIKKGKTKYNLNSNQTHSVLEYTKGVFFIATGHGGINIYNKQTAELQYHKNIKNDKSTIGNNLIYKIYRAPDGVIWIGSYNGGLNILNDKLKFEQYKYILQDNDRSKCCNSVLALCEDLDGNIWIGYDGFGIEVFNPNTLEVKHINSDNNSLKSNVVTSISRADNGDILIGYYLKGITHFNWKTKIFKHISHQSKLIDETYLDNVYDILPVGKNELLIATVGGGLKIYNLDTKQYAIYNNNNIGINNSVYKLLEDNVGDVWVGTQEGLCLYNRTEGTFKNNFVFDSINNLNNEKCFYDIYQDSKGKIWVATDDGFSLYRQTTDDFINYSEKDGLIGSSVKSILEDTSGNLWLSTNKGITKFNYEHNTFRNYDILDGLQGRSFNRNSGLITKDGKLYFGGPNGFNSFYPDKIKENTNIPPIFITEFKIANKVVSNTKDSLILKKHINYTNKISLTYKQSDISFKFTALNYVNTSANRYKYMLEGFDDSWVDNGGKREANYTNLNPGTYTFMVRGSNNDGIWNDIGKSILINISPPFWKTKWFLVLEILSLVLLIVLIVNLRNKKLRKDKINLIKEVESRTQQIKKQSEELYDINVLLEESKEEILQQNEALIEHKANLENVVAVRTQELLEAKDRAEESDKLKSSFLSNMSHEIRTPLNAILGFSALLGDKELVDDDREEFISIIGRNSDSLLLLIDDILDISTIESNRLILNKETFSVNEILNDLHINFVQYNKNHDLKVLLNNEIERDLFKIFSDKNRIIQVLTNLTQNAIKFTSRGFVEIGLCYKNKNIVFYIKDTGCGISESNQKIIFKRFRKIEDHADELFRGVGLGLSISKKLSDILGGELTVESTIGKGSTFYFSLPFDCV